MFKEIHYDVNALIFLVKVDADSHLSVIAEDPDDMTLGFGNKGAGIPGEKMYYGIVSRSGVYLILKYQSCSGF